MLSFVLRFRHLLIGLIARFVLDFNWFWSSKILEAPISKFQVHCGAAVARKIDPYKAIEKRSQCGPRRLETAEDHVGVSEMEALPDHGWRGYRYYGSTGVGGLYCGYCCLCGGLAHYSLHHFICVMLVGCMRKYRLVLKSAGPRVVSHVTSTITM